MRLFISHAQQDSQKIGQLVALLTQGGHDCPLEKQPRTARGSEAELQKALTQFDAFVYTLTPASVASEACQLEFVTAVEMRVPVVLVMLEGVDLPLFLNRYPYIDLTAGFTAEATAALLGELYGLEQGATLKELLEARPERKRKDQPRVLRRIVLATVTATLLVLVLVSRVELIHERLPTVNVCASGCDFNSISTALSYVEPGGTINIAAGVYEGAFTIHNSVTLRGEGIEQTIIKARDDSGLIRVGHAHPIQVSLESLTIGDCSSFSVFGRAEVKGANVAVTSAGLGLFVTDQSRVTLASAAISYNAHGIHIIDGARVMLVDSMIINNGDLRLGSSAIKVSDRGQLTLIGSHVENNANGVHASGSSKIMIEESTISRNGGGSSGLGIGAGIMLRDVATVEIRNTVIEGNGTTDGCLAHSPSGFQPCPGILVAGQADLIVENLTIRDNTDWGIAANLRQCGYGEDLFIGRVTFEGTNVIEGNNRSHNHDSMGNPGSHLWSAASPGQVCLPVSS